MARLNLANHEHRATHRALPLMELSNISYDIGSFYYYDLEYENEEYYHVIRNVWDYSVWSGERYQGFQINDSTGKTEEIK